MIRISPKVIVCLTIVLLITTPRLHASDTNGANVDETLPIERVIEILLRSDPNILLQERTVDLNQGQYQQATGEFDPVLTTTLRRSKTHDALVGTKDLPRDQYSYEIGVSKKFETGTVIKPAITAEKIDDDDPPGATAQPQYTGKVSFSVIQPLLEGRGEKAVSAQMDSARASLESERFALHHTIAQRLQTGISSYWSYLSAVKQVTIRRQSTERMQQLLEETLRLIEDGEKPEVERIQLEAQLSDRRARWEQARQTLQSSKHRLGVEIGLDPPEIDRLPQPSANFPRVNNLKATEIPAPGNMVSEALERRNDFRAREKAVEAQSRLLDRAENQQLDSLDLQLEFNYEGIEQGDDDSDLYYDIYGKNSTDLNVIGSLTYRWPVPGNEDQGRLEQQKARHQRARIDRQRIHREIVSGVEVAVSDLRAQWFRLREARQSLDSFQTALDNERERYQLGFSTIIDVINTEERLTQSNLQLIEAQESYARALVNLRFEVGMLYDAETNTIDPGAYRRLPSVSGENSP